MYSLSNISIRLSHLANSWCFTILQTEESRADVKNENASPPVKQSTNGVHEKKEPASSPVNGEHESSPELSDDEASPSKLDTSANEEEKGTYLQVI